MAKKQAPPKNPAATDTKAVLDQLPDVVDSDPYPDWDQARHKRIMGKLRFVGPGGNVYPGDFMGEHWADDRLQRQVCHGLDAENREVWKVAPDKPLPGFVSLKADDDDEDTGGDSPIPYDYELPPYADASDIQISNFDGGNPVGVETHVPRGEDQMAADLEAFQNFQPHDDTKPATA